jgi:hypothetical protein
LIEPLGALDRGGDDLGADIVDLQAARRDLARIDLDAHGRLLLAADGDKPTPSMREICCERMTSA